MFFDEHHPFYCIDIEMCDVCGRFFSPDRAQHSMPENKYYDYLDLLYWWQNSRTSIAVCPYCYKKCSKKFLKFIFGKK